MKVVNRTALLRVVVGRRQDHENESIGVGVGGYYAPPPVISYAPPCPGPGYSWVDGYWYPVGPRRVWHAGYWARPPYRGAYWVAPRFEGRRYFRGYWRR